MQSRRSTPLELAVISPELLEQPSYYCQQGTGFINQNDSAALCYECWGYLDAIARPHWQRIYRHVLAIGQELTGICCTNCGKRLTLVRDGRDCTWCKERFGIVSREQEYDIVGESTITITIHYRVEAAS